MRTITSFERLRAQMRAVTGDAGTAAREFERLQRFAAETPFSLQELIRGYIQLSAVSVEASDDVLTSLGNLASVFGNFGDLVTAVLSRERETFKRFGIDLRQNGEEITVAYRDFATTVENSSPGLVGALKEIADRFFPDGMQQRANSLEGALNNLGDTADALTDAFGRGGFAGALSGAARDASEFGSAARGLASITGTLAGHLLTATAALAPYAAALGAGRVAAAAAAKAQARFGQEARAARAQEAQSARDAALTRKAEAADRIAQLQARRQATAAATAEARAVASADLIRARGAHQALQAERTLGRVRRQTVGQQQARRARELASEVELARATKRAAQARRADEQATRSAATAQRRYDRVLAAHNRTIAAHNAQLATKARLMRGLRGVLGLMGGWIGLVTTALTLGSYAWLSWGSAARRGAEDARQALEDEIEGLRAAGRGPSGQIERLIGQVEARLRADEQTMEAARRTADNPGHGHAGRVARNAAQDDFDAAAARADRYRGYLEFLRAELARVAAAEAKIGTGGGGADLGPAEALLRIQERLTDQLAARRGEAAALAVEERRALAEIDALKGQAGVDEKTRLRAREHTVEEFARRRWDIERRAIERRREMERQGAEALNTLRDDVERSAAKREGPLAALAIEERRALAEIDALKGQAGVDEKTRLRVREHIVEEFARRRLEIEERLADEQTRIREAALARELQAEQAFLAERQRLTEAAATARADVEQQLQSGRDTLATPWERATAAIERWEATARQAVARQRAAAEALAAGGPDSALHIAAAAAEAERNLAEVTETAAARRASAWETEAQRRLQASRRWQDGATRALQALRAETGDYAALAERGIRSAFESAGDAIAEFVRTGKLRFGDLVENILAGLARIALQRALVGALGGALDAFALFSLRGAGGGASPTHLQTGTAPTHYSRLHTGGIAGALDRATRSGVPAAAFAGAPRLHAGGLPGLASDELPTILRRGEGVFTPAQMAALSPTPPQVTVNIENRGTAQQAGPVRRHFDGRQWVVGVVLEDVRTTGPITQGLQGRFGLPDRTG